MPRDYMWICRDYAGICRDHTGILGVKDYGMEG